MLPLYFLSPWAYFTNEPKAAASIAPNSIWLQICGVDFRRRFSCVAVGLFHGVIAQSGVATAPYSVYSHDESIDFHQYLRDVGHLFSCHGGRGATGLHDVIACLRQVPQSDIIAKRGNV